MTTSTMLDPIHPAHNNQSQEKGVGEVATKMTKGKTVTAVGGWRARRRRLRQRGGGCNDDDNSLCFTNSGGETLLHWSLCHCCNGTIIFIVLTSLLLLQWCHCCCCAGTFAVVTQVLLPSLRWHCCHCCSGLSDCCTGIVTHFFVQA